MYIRGMCEILCVVFAFLLLPSQLEAQAPIDVGDIPLGLLREVPVTVKNSTKRVEICSTGADRYCKLLSADSANLVGQYLEPNEEIKVKAAIMPRLPGNWMAKPHLYVFDPIDCEAKNLSVWVKFHARRDMTIEPSYLQLMEDTSRRRSSGRVVIEYWGIEDMMIKSVTISDESVTVDAKEILRRHDPSGVIRVRFEIVASSGSRPHRKIDTSTEVTLGNEDKNLLSFPILVRQP